MLPLHFYKNMANRARVRPDSVQGSNNNDFDSNPLESLELYYDRYKKIINPVVTVLLVVGLGYFVYMKFIKIPSEQKASAAMYYPELYFQADSLNMALNGDGQHPGFVKLTKKNSGTDAANVGLYYEGIAYMKSGNINEAIKALSSFDGHGTMLAYQAWGALGEAYMEMGNKTKAIEYLKKATSDKDNTVATPMYLFQLGFVYESNGQSKDAIDAFKRIRDEYPKSMQARDVDKELARLGELD